MSTSTGSRPAPRIVQITSCAVPGERRTFVNVYGLDEQSRVWQWNAKTAKWEPNQVRERKPAPAAGDDWGTR